jgi:probable F420-dependent oxidoreductase
VDVLSRGRLRLGVGIGWNEVEYEALGQDFHNRGRRVVEQITVLRTLWTQPLVSFHGRWHHISDAGINPLPVQRPIPLWMGGAQSGGPDIVLRRIGRLADGWMLTGSPSAEIERAWERVKEYARQAGRDPAAIGLEGGLRYRDGDPRQWRQQFEGWRRMGATHVSVNTMGAGLDSPTGHIDALRRVKQELQP